MGIHSLKQYNGRSICKMIFGKYWHTDILAAWQRVAICQERQPAFRPNMKRPPAGICRWIETSLRHLHIPACGHFIKNFGQDVSTSLHYGVGGFPRLYIILSGLPPRIFFCKGSCRHYQTSNREW